MYLFDESSDREVEIDLKLSYWRNKPNIHVKAIIEWHRVFDKMLNKQEAYDELRQCSFSQTLRPDSETLENVLSLLS